MNSYRHLSFASLICLSMGGVPLATANAVEPAAVAAPVPAILHTAYASISYGGGVLDEAQVTNPIALC